MRRLVSFILIIIKFPHPRQIRLLRLLQRLYQVESFNRHHRNWDLNCKDRSSEARSRNHEIKHLANIGWIPCPPPFIESEGTYTRSPSPEPPISGIGYHWQLQNTLPFPGFLWKSSRDYTTKKYPPPPAFPRKWEHVCGPLCIQVGRRYWIIINVISYFDSHGMWWQPVCPWRLCQLGVGQVHLHVSVGVERDDLRDRHQWMSRAGIVDLRQWDRVHQRGRRLSLWR